MWFALQQLARSSIPRALPKRCWNSDAFDHSTIPLIAMRVEEMVHLNKTESSTASSARDASTLPCKSHLWPCTSFEYKHDRGKHFSSPSMLGRCASGAQRQQPERTGILSVEQLHEFVGRRLRCSLDSKAESVLVRSILSFHSKENSKHDVLSDCIYLVIKSALDNMNKASLYPPASPYVLFD